MSSIMILFEELIYFFFAQLIIILIKTCCAFLMSSHLDSCGTTLNVALILYVQARRWILLMIGRNNSLRNADWMIARKRTRLMFCRGHTGVKLSEESGSLKITLVRTESKLSLYARGLSGPTVCLVSASSIAACK